MWRLKVGDVRGESVILRDDRRSKRDVHSAVDGTGFGAVSNIIFTNLELI